MSAPWGQGSLSVLFTTGFLAPGTGTSTKKMLNKKPLDEQTDEQTWHHRAWLGFVVLMNLESGTGSRNRRWWRRSSNFTLGTVRATHEFLAVEELNEDCFSKDKALYKPSLHQ